ncbi:MAG TPA: hypothetical protein VH165_02815 [Kofleriaceae bacterium]|nr:hypothetical protein [Kofleriaceae bacterium]
MQPFTLVPVFRGLHREMWIVSLITVISCAVLAARATSSVVSARYFPVGACQGPARRLIRRAPPPQPAHPEHPAGALAQRNMFCSSCTPDLPGSAGAEIALAPAVLIATSLGAEPRATVHVLGSDVQGSWGLGETIPGVGWIHQIAPKWIDVTALDGRHGRMYLLAPAADRGSRTAMRESPAAARPWSARIQPIDDHTYEVDRSLIRELLGGEIPRNLGRIVPVVDHGRFTGFRIYAFGPASLPAAIGLRNGDQVFALNGISLDSERELMDLYVGLDQLASVELLVRRNGETVARTLRLR